MRNDNSMDLNVVCQFSSSNNRGPSHSHLQTYSSSVKTFMSTVANFGESHVRNSHVSWFSLNGKNGKHGKRDVDQISTEDGTFVATLNVPAAAVASVYPADDDNRNT